MGLLDETLPDLGEKLTEEDRLRLFMRMSNRGGLNAFGKLGYQFSPEFSGAVSGWANKHARGISGLDGAYQTGDHQFRGSLTPGGWSAGYSKGGKGNQFDVNISPDAWNLQWNREW